MCGVLDGTLDGEVVLDGTGDLVRSCRVGVLLPATSMSRWVTSSLCSDISEISISRWNAGVEGVRNESVFDCVVLERRFTRGTAGACGVAIAGAPGGAGGPEGPDDPEGTCKSPGSSSDIVLSGLIV